MKGREIREALQGKMDPTQLHCLCSVAENVSALEVELTALSQLLNSMTDVLGGIVETMEAVKDAVGKQHDI